MQACSIVTLSDMAFSPSPAVPLLLLLSSLALAGFAHAQNGACNTITNKKTCKAQSSCCWKGTCGSVTFATDRQNCGSCGKVCNKKDSCCNGICLSTSSDGNNCGACGNQCTGGTICIAGVCKCPCSKGNLQCWTGIKCVKLVTGSFATDTSNCGNCGNQCAAGASCCSRGNPGTCTDTSTDSSNCGACGNRCAAGSPCVNSVCGCSTDLSSDAANCGVCGNKCPAGSTCCSGKCVDTTSDPKNCGSCGNQLPSGSTCCGGSASDTSSDAKNCGACGTICPKGWSCVSGGQCGLYLPANNEVVIDWSVVFQLPEPGRGYIQFTALASNDVHVMFNPVPGATDQPRYGIYVGGNSNMESAIVHALPNEAWYRDYYWQTVMENPGGLNDLWMSMDKTTETVEVGRGVRGTSSSRVIMSFHDEGRFISNVQYMAFGAFSTPITYTNIAVHGLEGAL